MLSILGDAWSKLPGNVRGALLILLGSMFFAANDAMVKFVGGNIHPVQIALIRYSLGVVFLAPMFVRLGLTGLKTARIGLHLGRALVATIGQLAVYYAVVHLMLADATAIMFSRPLFITVLAVVLLGETVGWRRWSATIVGFAGMVVMVRPGQMGFDPASMVAIAAALLFALSLVLIRKLASTEPPARILFYYHVSGSLLFLGPALWLWVEPSALQWLLLFLIGVLTTIGMVCFVRGFAVGEASIVGPMEYSRLVYAALVGYFVFAELPDAWTWVGAAIIVASTLYVTRHEAMSGRRPMVG
ncbi:MAG: hypothetical protein A3G25_20175 [Betaproteobacteria bacterium RIFCSPLOWO2_12_FULL_63_13]|nr:MAG: hypothetical protein A3G25_20175 [Betaproteobacteria bacterium RIFCSPLOWO2_12_FULL_63_13]